MLLMIEDGVTCSFVQAMVAAGQGRKGRARRLPHRLRARGPGTRTRRRLVRAAAIPGTSSRSRTRHNGRGERIAKLNITSPGSTAYYVYDEAGRLLGEYKSTGVAIKEYVWLDDRPVAVIGGYQGHRFQYVLTDHLGTPRAVVNPATNAIIWRWDLTGSAFGNHARQANPDGDSANYVLNLRYPGQYYDGESGLHYNYFRDYDPATGRYVQSDPIGLGGGTSTYGYVSAGPLSGVDPLGLFMEYCRDKSILRIRFHVKVAADEEAQAQVDKMLRLAGDSWTGTARLPGVFGDEVAFVHTEVVRSNLPTASPLRVSSTGGFTPSSGEGGRGTWHLGMSKMSIAHETGHFFGNGLWDAHFNNAESYAGTSIMLPRNLEDMGGPTARDFATLLDMFRRNSKDCSCTAW